MLDARVIEMGEGLKPTSEGVRVRFSGSNRTVTRGPFAETNELVAGFWIWTVGNLDQAIDWVKRCPNPMLEDSDIEIRPMYEMADFAEIDPSGGFESRREELCDRLRTQNHVVQNYLFFSGQCEEALEFYRDALGARIGMVLKFNQSPDPVPEGMLQPGFEDKVMHAEFEIGKTKILASDGCNDQGQFGGFRLALQVPTEEDADRAFEALAQGGTIDMPIGKTFFSPRYGMVTDKFNVGWMVMVPGQ
ncbi:MAG: YciI family protein [Pirellulaceae bacterium]